MQGVRVKVHQWVRHVQVPVDRAALGLQGSLALAPPIAPVRAPADAADVGLEPALERDHPRLLPARAVRRGVVDRVLDRLGEQALGGVVGDLGGHDGEADDGVRWRREEQGAEQREQDDAGRAHGLVHRRLGAGLEPCDALRPWRRGASSRRRHPSSPRAPGPCSRRRSTSRSRRSAATARPASAGSSASSRTAIFGSARWAAP